MGSELPIEDDYRLYRLVHKPNVLEVGRVRRAVHAVTHPLDTRAPRMFRVSLRYGIPLLIVVFTAVLAAYTTQKEWGAAEAVPGRRGFADHKSHSNAPKAVQPCIRHG